MKNYTFVEGSFYVISEDDKQVCNNIIILI